MWNKLGTFSIAESYPLPNPLVLAKLRETLSALETGGFRRRPALPFGIEAVDARLADKGMRLDALHEVAGAGADLADDCAASLFLAGIAARAWGPVLWVVRRQDLQIVFINPPD